MNIQEAKQEIINTVKAYLLKDSSGEYRIPKLRQRPILLMGPPGIGKTQIMEQIAVECEIGLVSYTITHHTRQSAVGLPMINREEFMGQEYSVTEYTMSEIIAGIYKAMKQNGKLEGILFIDEINCVSETLIPTMLQFLQCKTFGNQAIPDGWIIVAAGNPPEYNRSVREFDMVTLDRVRLINIEADLQVWKRYAFERNIHNAVISYLDLKPANFYKVVSDVDGLMFVTARGWEDLSSLMQIYEELEIGITYDVIREFIKNEDVAEDFSAYYELYNKYRDDYGIEDILNNAATTALYRRLRDADFDERLTVVNLMLDALDKEFIQVAELKKNTDEWFYELKKNMSEGIDVEDEKERFKKQAEKLGDIRKCTLSKLEHAFEFLEGEEFTLKESVGDIGKLNQEMLIFVTGLTLGKASSAFLLDNVCDKYIKYSEALLGNGRRNNILRQIE